MKLDQNRLFLIYPGFCNLEVTKLGSGGGTQAVGSLGLASACEGAGVPCDRCRRSWAGGDN